MKNDRAEVAMGHPVQQSTAIPRIESRELENWRPKVPRTRHVATIGLGTARTVLCVVCGGFKLLARDKGRKAGREGGGAEPELVSI